ncbi:hypothetical protein ACH4GK_17725 [Streptomyces rimosus]|uniref:hypothetical protein n=1 Tax=Streptomyces rimosus TaxID=1927 RepID=UPI00067BF18A|nr:hypothetical protein [Streptomyces rimosus]
MLDLAVTAALLTAGYALGRIRPWDRLDTWVRRRLTFGGTWTRTRRGRLFILTAHALVYPAATVHAWRHRHDPPPGRSAPLTFRTADTEDTDHA